MINPNEIIEYDTGLVIDEPCIVRNMPIEVYHAHPALSESGLKMLLNCPAKYYYKYLSGEYEQKEKPNFKIGKACHCYILEGREEFEKRYWHNPYTEWKKDDLVRLLQETYGYDCTIKKFPIPDLMEIILDKAGIEPKEIHLTANELNLIVGTAKAIKANKRANNAFSQKGESELSLFWQDEATGIWLKCRPDFLPYDCLNIPDYKTASSVQPVEFFKSFINFGYHVEAAMYRMGIKAVCGVEVENFFFVAQEKEPPYITEAFTPDDRLIIAGEKTVQAGILKFIECKESGVWEAYSNSVIELSTAPKPDDLISDFDKGNSICYAPFWVDRIMTEYEA